MKKRRAPGLRRDAGRARGTPIVDQVLSAALDELARSGVEGFSVHRVAEQSAVNKTSVYRRWPTREALISAALERVLEQVERQTPDTGALETDLLALLSPLAELLGQPRGLALTRAALSSAAEAEVSALAAAALTRAAPAGVAALVARARRRGEWRPGLDPRLVLFTLVGALLHRVLLERQPASPAWLRRCVRLLLTGVVPRGSLRR